PIQDVTKLDQEASVIGERDRTHVLKGYVTWSLPFGAKNALVSGWSVSLVFRYESGLPLAFTSSNSYAGWFYPIYVDRNANVSAAAPFNAWAWNPANPADPANRYFNPAAFSNPAYGSLGTGPGRFADLRGFGGAYEDVGILKDVKVGRYTAQVKLDIFNVFNRRYLADPVTDISSPLFGQVTSTGAQPPRQGQLRGRFTWWAAAAPTPPACSSSSSPRPRSARRRRSGASCGATSSTSRTDRRPTRRSGASTPAATVGATTSCSTTRIARPRTSSSPTARC